MVFEFCEHDLAGLLSNPEVKFPLEETKDLIRQLFRALQFIHNSNILHRDMKASNIFITREGRLKLGDFGLARTIAASKTQPAKYTNRVVTLWYRAPELLLGDRNYGYPIDLWGVGCIMAEMWIRSPILQGHSEQHQLRLITCLCGTISPRVWPDVEKLEYYGKLSLTEESRKVVERLSAKVGNRHAVDLIDKLLVLDPSRRITSKSALEHEFFSSSPLPVSAERTLRHLPDNCFEMTAPQRPRQGGTHIPRPRETQAVGGGMGVLMGDRLY